MRGWGFTFLATAAGCVILAQFAVVLAFWLIGIVSAAALVSWAAGCPERRLQRELAQAEQTKLDADYFRGMAADDAAEAEWAALVNATTPRPLGPRRPLVDPDRLRQVARIPSQREATR